MKISEEVLSVSYGQIVVHQSGVDDPFNFWTDAHLVQGFAWRSESTGFRTLDQYGEHRVHSALVERFADPESWSRRKIVFPFMVYVRCE